MICYRDKTWCPFGDECKKANKCHRAFSASDHYQAVKWWGSEDYPICFFTTKPDCFEAKEMIPSGKEELVHSG